MHRFKREHESPSRSGLNRIEIFVLPKHTPIRSSFQFQLLTPAGHHLRYGPLQWTYVVDASRESGCISWPKWLQLSYVVDTHVMLNITGRKCLVPAAASSISSSKFPFISHCVFFFSLDPRTQLHILYLLLLSYHHHPIMSGPQPLSPSPTGKQEQLIGTRDLISLSNRCS